MNLVHFLLVLLGGVCVFVAAAGDGSGSAAAGITVAGGDVTKERPRIRKLGYAFGLAAPIVAGGVTGTMIYVSTSKTVVNNITNTVPANCNHDAVKDEIKKLENTGFLVTLQCK